MRIVRFRTRPHEQVPQDPFASKPGQHFGSSDFSQSSSEAIALGDGVPMLRNHNSEPGQRRGPGCSEHIQMRSPRTRSPTEQFADFVTAPDPCFPREPRPHGIPVPAAGRVHEGVTWNPP